MEIRQEKSSDIDEVRRLVEFAFKPVEFSDDTEALALDMMREDGDLLLSLVAVENDEILGHIAFSCVKTGDEEGKWCALGPIAVLPKHQKRGVGKRLIEKSLFYLKEQNVKGCVLIGDPNYYNRFGFVSDDSITYRDVPSRYVQWLSFSGSQPVGELLFCNGLEKS